MATTTSNPWRGTHQVGIGASLGKALKAKKNGTEAGTSSPAPSTGPGKARRNLPDREFYSLRYQHKPSSIDPRKPGRIQFTTKEGSTTPSIVIEQASNQPKESVMFSGQEYSLNKLDCVLIYDEDTGTFTLEKLDGGLKLSLDRSLQSIMPRDSSPSSSTPSPDPAPSHNRTGSQLSSSRRKPPSDRDAFNDIDDEIAAVALDTKLTPRPVQSKPPRHQKEEQEEEEELPLIQQQKIQQDQRRRQEEQEERERAEAVRKQEEERAEATRREQERIREQKEELRRLKQKHDQEKKEKEEEEKRRREKELHDQKEREQLAREQEQRRLEQQQQEQQRRFISTNKPKVKGPPKKKAPVNPFMPKPPPPSSSSLALPASSSSRSLPKRPAEDNPDVEEFGSIVPQRPVKAPKTKPSQTTATSPKRPFSSGGLVLPGSSNSLSALAPEPTLPSSNSIQRYGPSSQKAKAAPAPVAPPPVPQGNDDSDDESQWEQVDTNEMVPSRGATPVASSANVDDMVDEIFGDLSEEEDPIVEDPGTLDLDNELEREFEEAGLGPSISDSDDDMEPVSAGLPMDQDGPPMSLNQMLGGLPAPDTDYSSSSEDDSDY